MSHIETLSRKIFPTASRKMYVNNHEMKAIPSSNFPQVCFPLIFLSNLLILEDADAISPLSINSLPDEHNLIRKIANFINFGMTCGMNLRDAVHSGTAFINPQIDPQLSEELICISN